MFVHTRLSAADEAPWNFIVRFTTLATRGVVAERKGYLATRGLRNSEIRFGIGIEKNRTEPYRTFYGIPKNSEFRKKSEFRHFSEFQYLYNTIACFSHLNVT